MNEESKTKGKCLFCGKMYSIYGINRHLALHLQEKVKSGEPGTSFLVKVVPDKNVWGESFPHFLSLWIDGEAFMDDFDSFLRKIWLECCHHGSAFRKNQKVNTSKYITDDFLDLPEFQQRMIFTKLGEEVEATEVYMEDEANQVLQKGLKLKYVYDFGDKTQLIVTVIEQYPMKADAAIVLLSRNEPLNELCDNCGITPATKMCTVCQWNGRDSMFCDPCAEKHASECEPFAEYASRLVVNSPRMGVCVYSGGSIDLERDR